MSYECGCCGMPVAPVVISGAPVTYCSCSQFDQIDEVARLAKATPRFRALFWCDTDQIAVNLCSDMASRHPEARFRVRQCTFANGSEVHFYSKHDETSLLGYRFDWVSGQLPAHLLPCLNPSTTRPRPTNAASDQQQATPGTAR